MATPAARALRRRFPQATIDWLVEDRSAQVVLDNPNLDQVLVVDRARWNRLLNRHRYRQVLLEFSRLLLFLRRRRYHLAIDFQGMLRSTVFTLVTGAPIRMGSSRSRELARLTLTHPVAPNPHPGRAGKQYLHLIASLGIDTSDCDLEITLSPSDRSFADSYLESHGLSRGFVALCPATTRPQKHWSSQGFAQTADLLYSASGLPSLILGSSADLPLADQIGALAAHPPVTATGQTSLKQAAALLERASLVVTVDNGPLHLAVAMKRPVVALFGSTNAERYLEEPRVAIVKHDFPCSPCRKRPRCSGYPCMASITPDEVTAVARRLLRTCICA